MKPAAPATASGAATAAPEAPAAKADAQASGLRYVSLDDPGIQRRRAGKGFVYLGSDGTRIESDDELRRIRALAIPPAWTDVWICADPRGHIQAIGRDARGRRQYRYHADFRARRDKGKFDRLIRFGEGLPVIRRRVRRDLALRGLPREKVLAAVVSLLEATRFRVGNAEYARLNKSFGISTLRDRHARIVGGKITFRFRGKGGRSIERTVLDRRLAGVVRRCQELPGQVLFQYLDDEGEVRSISSEDVNAYIREAAGTDEFSAKDFRTWTATVQAYRALRTPEPQPQPEAGGATRKRRESPVMAALRRTAEDLGDTVAVTRASYVHPGVLDAVAEEAQELGTAANVAAKARRSNGRSLDSPISRRDELAVLAILRRQARGGPSRRAPDARRPQVPRNGRTARARRSAA